jgi:wyosine [tRNA(Phe)-imidazoG37] synthetase (radical SAM superfamily)
VLIEAHKDHRRVWDEFYYVYPVISRRSQGVSIGINLNPDKVCNFDCIYCEVDRKTVPRIRQVNLEILTNELRSMIEIWKTGALFDREPFSSTPEKWRRLNDIAFSGDGEPTTCPVFAEAVQIAFDLRNELTPKETKLVLITDSACLDRPNVKKGLELFKKGAYSIWAKLDAGTEAYYKTVNRTAIPYARILKNITETSKWLPLTVQSLFLRVHGEPPNDGEISVYCDRLEEILKSGGKILSLQLYTVARPTPEPWATPLKRVELDHIAELIKRRIDLPQELAYGPED